METTSTIDWTFGGTWPFTPRYHGSGDGRLHYVDEGPRDAPAVVLVHGNPTWGYLYRRLITPLVERGRRVIVPDLLGFGRSASPPERGLYTIERHAARTAALLDELAPRDVTLAVHDWGGPIGLRWAAERPQVVARLMLFNTFAPRLPAPMGARASIRALRAPGLGPLLVRRRNLPVEDFLLGAGLADPRALDEQAKAAYRAPHADPAGRTGMLAFPREIPFSSRHPVSAFTAATARALATHFSSRPVTLCWGMRDILFGEPVLDLWRELLPHARVRRVEAAGHFVVEDAPAEAHDALEALALGT